MCGTDKEGRRDDTIKEVETFKVHMEEYALKDLFIDYGNRNDVIITCSPCT